MRLISIAPGEHYHIFNRGVNKQVIFHDLMDYTRFLFLILYLQSPIKFPQVGRLIKQYVKSSAFDTGDEDQVINKRTVELVAFSIMPNHFHLLVKELGEGNISVYMQRVLTAYSKYYNTKYNKSGHVFQGPYRFVHVADNNQLLHLSAYIHRNCREISKWFKKEDQYQWSSYQDFINKNRWGGLISSDIVIEQFKNKSEYERFVKTSLTKIVEGELDLLDSH